MDAMDGMDGRDRATARRRRCLRFFLVVAAFAWGISVAGVFLPWPVAVYWLQHVGGAGAIPDDPMANYWLRMAAGAFTLVGALFAAAAWRPERYAAVIPLYGWMNLIEGVILLVSGLLLHLAPLPFWADTAFCFVCGAGILWCCRSAAVAPPVATPPRA